jgi:hypothetical protein
MDPAMLPLVFQVETYEAAQRYPHFLIRNISQPQHEQNHNYSIQMRPNAI